LAAFRSVSISRCSAAAAWRSWEGSASPATIFSCISRSRSPAFRRASTLLRSFRARVFTTHAAREGFAAPSMTFAAAASPSAFSSFAASLRAFVNSSSGSP
jgi:hypothetical protein